MATKDESGRCSECGAVLSVKRGQSAPTHQRRGSRETCPGSGRSTV
jgi:hypothetical protein